MGVATNNVAFLNPITGQKSKAAVRSVGDKREVYLQLRSGESLLIYDTKEPLEPHRYLGDKGESVKGHNWTLSFAASNPTVEESFELAQPCDWTTLSPELKVNCGTGCYTGIFNISDVAIADEWILDLGDVRASAKVKINGHEVATAWAVPFVLQVRQWLHDGDNTIEICVTNLPANRMAQMDREGVQWRIFKDANIVSSKYKQLSCADWETAPSGLLQDVVLYPINSKTIKSIIK